MSLCWGLLRQRKTKSLIKPSFLRNDFVWLSCDDADLYIGISTLNFGTIFLPPSPTLRTYFFSRAWEKFIGERFVIREGRTSDREKFSPLPCLTHVRDDLRNKCLVFFFRMLLIENAILAALQSKAAETVFDGGETRIAVENIRDPLPAVIAEECAIDIVATPIALIEKLAP